MDQRIASLGDEQLVSEALRSRDAFALLVQRYQERLARYVRRLGVFRTEDVEDILQNVFLKIYRNLNGFDPRLKFSSWAYRIAHNETISFFRVSNARPEVFPDKEDDLLDRIPAALDVERDAAHTMDAAHLRAVLAKLPEKYRDVLILRYFEERDYAEIADVLRKPPGTVATLLNRGKKKLAELLDRETIS